MATVPARRQSVCGRLLGRDACAALRLATIRCAAHLPPAPGAQRPTGIACGAAPAHGAAAAGHYDEEESLRGLPAALERQQIQPRPARFAHCAAHCPGAGLGAGAYGHAAAHQSAVGGRDHGERRARYPVFEGRPGTVDPHRATFRQQSLGA